MVHFEIDNNSDVPIWLQLRKRLIYLINTGHLKPGEQLPTVRGLATDLAINYNTVNKAYMSMVQNGYLVATRGRGVFVSNIIETDEEETLLDAEALLDEYIERCREIGLSAWGVRKVLAKRLRALDADRPEEEKQANKNKIVRITKTKSSG